jgi:uncharacterized protein YfdQ (DUF2303 family)
MSSVFHDLVKKKLAAMRAKFPPIHSPHEGLALVWEEFRELRKDVMKRKRKGDPLRLLNELVDLAAICEMFAEDQCGRERTD